MRRLFNRYLTALPLLALVAFVLAFTGGSRPTYAHHLCGNTGSPFGAFDLQTYEAADYRNVYARTMELAGWNQLLPEYPTFAPPAMETGNRGAGSGSLVGPYIPPVLLKSIAWIESGWAQGSYDPPVQYGQIGPVLSSHDCGYGIMQITSGMQNVSGVPTLDQAMIGGHYAFNIARGARILAEKWNASPEYRPIVGSRNPTVIEDWYYALWGYNGFAFKNHPLNPDYAWPRPAYDCGSSRSYPYQELILGCAQTPPVRGGAQLWNSQPVTLPNLSDPAFYEHLKLDNWNPCSSNLQCAAMDIPTPNPAHQDPSGSGLTRAQVLGTPSVVTSTSSVSLVASPGGQSPTQSIAIGNGGSGVLAWRLTATEPWLRLSRIQGVSLGADLGYTHQIFAVSADASSLLPGTYTAQIKVDSLYAAGSPATINVTVQAGDGALLNTPDGAIYVFEGGLKRHIPDPATFEANGFSWYVAPTGQRGTHLRYGERHKKTYH
ncbi:MAG: lytic transglycosylase domain-containing protein [Chloroflexi bacterium]|nr:MAG: lytic transglycosylase domain-containing protein [Chloroflexota bacterium]